MKPRLENYVKRKNSGLNHPLRLKVSIPRLCSLIAYLITRVQWDGVLAMDTFTFSERMTCRLSNIEVQTTRKEKWYDIKVKMAGEKSEQVSRLFHEEEDDVDDEVFISKYWASILVLHFLILLIYTGSKCPVCRNASLKTDQFDVEKQFCKSF